jgi:hypothetical protein
MRLIGVRAAGEGQLLTMNSLLAKHLQDCRYLSSALSRKNVLKNPSGGGALMCTDELLAPGEDGSVQPSNYRPRRGTCEGTFSRGIRRMAG